MDLDYLSLKGNSQFSVVSTIIETNFLPNSMSVSFSEANCWKNVALSSNGGVASCRKTHNCHRVIRNLLSLICQTQGYFVTNISKLKWLMLKFQMKVRVKCWTIIFRNLSEAASKCSYFISLLDNRWILESVFGSISRVQFTQSGFLGQNSIWQIWSIHK